MEVSLKEPGDSRAANIAKVVALMRDQSVFVLGAVAMLSAISATAKPYLLVPDYITDEIHEFDSSGNYLGVWADLGSGSHVAWMEWGPSGNLYVAEFTGTQVRVFSATGADLGVFAGVNILGAAGMDFDTAGNLYVANYAGGSAGAGYVSRYDLAGNYIDKFVTGISGPRDIDFDSVGNLCVAEREGAKVSKFSSTGTHIKSTAVGPSPYGLAVDSFDNVYVQKEFGGEIVKFDADLNSLGVFAAGTCDSAASLAFGPDGNLYSGRATCEIARWQPDGVSLGLFSSILSFDASRLNGLTFSRQFSPDGADSIVEVPDLNTNNLPELGVILSSGGLKGYVKDADTDKQLGAQVFNSDRTPLDNEVADINGSPAMASLGMDATGRAWVEVRNAVTGTLIRDVWFSAGYTPIALAVLPDMNGNSSSELAVLITKPSDSDRAWVHIKDASSGAYVNNLWFEADYSPLDVEYVPNVDGNPGPEVAVLMARDSDNNRAWVHLKDAATGNYVKNVWFQAGYTPKDLAIIDNLDGNPGSEIAVLMVRDSDLRPWVHIKDGLSGAYVKNVWFDSGFVPSGLGIVPDLDGKNGDDLAILTARNLDGRTWVHIKDAPSGDYIKKVWFQGEFAPKGFAVLSEMDANPGAELAVLGTKSDGQVQAEIKDAKTGAYINKMSFP